METDQKTNFTVSVTTENSPGMLNRILLIFSRRNMTVLKLKGTLMESSNLFHYTLIIETDAEQLTKVLGQLEKQVEVYQVKQVVSEQ